MTTLILTILVLSCSTRAYGDEKLQFWRMASSNLNKTAYFFGKTFAHSFAMFYLPIFFHMFYYTLLQPRGYLRDYMIFTFLISFVGQAMAQLLSIIVHPGKTAIICGAIAAIMVFVSGQQPTLKSLESSPITLAVATINPCRWLYEGLWVSEVMEWPPVYGKFLKEISKSTGRNLENGYEEDIEALVVLGFVFRFLTWVALHVANRSKQL